MKRESSYQPSKAELEKLISIDATPDDLGRATVTSMRKAKKLLKVVAGAEDRPLAIGDIEIQCYVLEDETRVLSQAGMFRGLSLAKRGGSVAIDGGAQVPRFAASKALTPHISSDLAAALSTPIEFQPPGGGRTAYGYPAAILVDLCKAVLAAAVLSEPPRPVSRSRCALCIFFALPPTNVSSASTGPANGPPSRSCHISRSRCDRCHADFCVMLRSRCSFIDETPFSEVVSR